jgi:hypothetical protein
MVVHAFRDAEHDGLVASLAWVVMPDHFHWLFELKAGSLNELMKRVRGRSAIEINRAKGTKGRVWQRGYHDRAVRYDDDVIAIARYIIANSVKGGDCKASRGLPVVGRNMVMKPHRFCRSELVRESVLSDSPGQATSPTSCLLQIGRQPCCVVFAHSMAPEGRYAQHQDGDDFEAAEEHAD